MTNEELEFIESSQTSVLQIVVLIVSDTYNK